MSKDWFLSRNGRQHGPFTPQQVKKGAANGKVKPDDLVWHEGMAGWAPASTISGLFATDPLDEGRTRSGTLPSPVSTSAKLDMEKTLPRSQSPNNLAPAASLDVESTMPRARSTSETKSIGSLQGTPPQRSQASTPPLGHEFKVGQVVDKFLITKTLGRGGMGIVYKATDVETEVEYAIKVLTPELVADPNALADLKKEVAVAQALTHQNLLKVNYLTATGSTNFVVMEYIDGENLEEYRLRKGGKLSPDEFHKIASQILAGLEYLHEKGVVHLDIKPHNVMLTKGGEVKITDYGIARTIKDQLYLSVNSIAPTGTLCYMAPEQFRSGTVCDRRTDIYAVGIMFYLLLSGRYPFSVKDREQVVNWHIDPAHTIEAMGSASLTEVVQRALRVARSERWPSCKEMLDSLDDRQQISPIPADSQESRSVLAQLEQLLGVALEQCVYREGSYRQIGSALRSPDGNYSQWKVALSPLSVLSSAFTGPNGEGVDIIDELTRLIRLNRYEGQRLGPNIKRKLRALVTEAEDNLDRGPSRNSLSVLTGMGPVSQWKKYLRRIIAEFG